MKLIIKHSQLGRELSGTLWQLVHVEVEGDIALQAEEAAAAAALLEDGLLRQAARFAEEHQQVPVQKPESTAWEWLIILHLKYVHRCSTSIYIFG